MHPSSRKQHTRPTHTLGTLALGLTRTLFALALVAALLSCTANSSGGPDTDTTLDSTSQDTSTADTGSDDTGTPDTGTPDTGTPDTGSPDTFQQGPENTNAACSDGVDNDQNGFTDCNDWGCSRNASVTVCGTESNDTLCGDGIDNDQNGFTDCEDLNCSENTDVTVCDAECTSNAECTDDGDACNGSAECLDGSCTTGDPLPVDTACSTPSGQDGTCQDENTGRACVPAGCGNGVVEGAEQCDEESAGCTASCEWVCTSDADCTDMDACNGTETCDLSTHTCSSGTAPTCDDNDSCTSDSCDAGSGCVYTLIDSDNDGVAPGCGDCNDNDAAIYTGNSEICDDGKDNDCDGTVDNGITIWWVDCDGDGYAAANATSQTACMKPAGSLTGCNGTWTTRNPSANADCRDDEPNVNPGATEIVGNGRDDDCNGEELCYADGDGDGHADWNNATVVSSDSDCNDAGEADMNVARDDCCDIDPNTYSGNTNWYSLGDPTSKCGDPWSFDCDGSADKRWTDTLDLRDCPVVSSCVRDTQGWGYDPSGGGWAGCAYYPGSSGPPCGSPAYCWVEKCGSGGSCQYEYLTRTQECR